MFFFLLNPDSSRNRTNCGVFWWWDELWSVLVVGLDTLGWPEVSASFMCPVQHEVGVTLSWYYDVSLMPPSEFCRTLKEGFVIPSPLFLRTKASTGLHGILTLMSACAAANKISSVWSTEAFSYNFHSCSYRRLKWSPADKCCLVADVHRSSETFAYGHLTVIIFWRRRRWQALVVFVWIWWDTRKVAVKWE